MPPDYVQMMKDKGFKILFVIYLAAFAGDVASTISGGLYKYLEANILFKWGGIWLIILFNLVFMAVWWYLYAKGSISTRFIVSFSLVAIIMIRVIAITNNIAIARNPPTIEQAMAVTQAMKTETIVRLAAVNIFPFFNGIIAWIFFRPDHSISRKDR